MMRLYLICLFTTVLTLLQGQNAFYDALALSNYLQKVPGAAHFVFDASKEAEVYSILLKYAPSLADSASHQEIRTAYDANPFIGTSNSPVVDISSMSLSQTTSVGKSLLNAGSGLLDADISKYVDGLAKFLVERFNEELNIHFIAKFQEFINQYPEAETIFPNTNRVIDQFSSYQYATILQVLRESFEKDVETFAENLLQLTTLTSADCPTGDTNCMARIDTLVHHFQTELGSAYVTTLLTIRELVEGINPRRLIDDVVNDAAFQNMYDGNLKNCVKLVDLFSDQIASNTTSYWVKPSELEKLLLPKHGRLLSLDIFLGLLYQLNQSNPNYDITFNSNGVNKTLGQI
ncbi:MAG: hypothetical protein AAGD05_15625, partial [Bacteroidota bacterium]